MGANGITRHYGAIGKMHVMIRRVTRDNAFTFDALWRFRVLLIRTRRAQIGIRIPSLNSRVKWLCHVYS
jgi:hypothetical protein